MTDEANDPNVLDELILGHFDGCLTEDQERELTQALVDSTVARQLFLSYMRIEGRLQSLGQDGYLRKPDTAVNPWTDSTPPVRNDAQRTYPSRARLWATSSSLAVCAALILLLGWFVLPSSVSAGSVLRQAKLAAVELVDRTYRVTVAESNAESRPATQELMINVRGGRHFVIQPIDGSYVMGSDGTDFWITQPRGPVWITRDYRSLDPKLQRRIPNRQLLGLAANRKEPLMMLMPSLLSLIERDYDFDLLESDVFGQNHVQATLRVDKRFRPRIIEFWADNESGVVRRVDFKWTGRGLTRLELVDSPTLSEDWYHHSRHAPDQQVRRLGGFQHE